MECIHSMIETLATALSDKMSCGVDCVDTHEAGEVADIIKDLSEAELNLTKIEHMPSVM